MHVVHTLFEAHLPVADLDASVAFYRDQIGLDLAHVLPGRAAFLWIGGRGRAMLGLWSAGGGPQKVALHVAFSTITEVLAAPRRLRAAGITAARLRWSSNR
jgi:catechol 2,3-dioxygenase-like lactoylglutathione lyase family enzyme